MHMTFNYFLNTNDCILYRPQNVRRGSEKLLQFDDFGSPTVSSTTNSSSSSSNPDDLLGFNSPVQSSSALQTPSLLASDFLGLDGKRMKYQLKRYYILKVDWSILFV